jgi:hypothetical protein
MTDRKHLTADESAVDIERSWKPVDLTDILAGTYTPPKPTVGQRNDGVGLFYPGKLHSVASESEAGKTWLLIVAAFDEIKAGNHCLYVDFEDCAEGIAGRLQMFGLSAQQILDQFHYIRPDETVNTEQNLADLREALKRWRPTLAIVDGVTEAMTMHGLNINDNTDIAAFAATLPRKLARAGCATVCLDHVVKDKDGRGRYAIGGVHKLNGIDGAAYILEARDPFGDGLKGRSTILIAKDRPGQLRKHGQRRPDGLTDFGELIVDCQTETDAEFEIRPSIERTGQFRPTVVMAKISNVFEQHDDKAMSQREVLDIVGGKSTTARHAFSLLRIEGYISEKPHKLIRSYSGGENGAENQ